MQPKADYKDYRQEKLGVSFDDFGGLMTNTGRLGTDSTANSASAQLNLCNICPGELTTRAGLRPVTFDEDSA